MIVQIHVIVLLSQNMKYCKFSGLKDGSEPFAVYNDTLMSSNYRPFCMTLKKIKKTPWFWPSVDANQIVAL